MARITHSTYISSSPQQTHRIAKQILTKFPESKLICLVGDLGAGKTTLTHGIGKLFNIHDVQSPTYTYVREYLGKKRKLIHYDLYRINSFMEFISLGFYEHLDEKDALIIIEWADKVQDDLPLPRIEVYMEFLSHMRRKIEVKVIEEVH